MEEPPPITANTIAAHHFEKDIQHHDELDQSVNTVVIIHDACYGHRYSRPKTTKATLSMIVERPERILASAMGISAAYVRLGEHHSGGRNAPHPKMQASTNPPFRIHRTSRTVALKSDAVTAVHGTEWMKELQTMCDRVGEKLSSTGKELERTEPPKGETKQQFHEGDLYLCTESINAFEGALGGVCDGVDAVFNGTASGKGPYQAFVCIRPPGHHCSSDYPSGFCWINNVHVGIQHAVQNYGLTHAAIIDFDLHHGDGSQEITWGHNERMFYPVGKPLPNSKQNYIGYFSLHDINSYPCENGDREKTQNASLCVDNAHGQSVWNVHLQEWKTVAEFWELYENRYMVLIEKARSFLKHHTNRLRTGAKQPHPKAAIFLSAGFDASEHESDGMQRHKVNVPTEFYARFTRDVVALAQEEGTSVEGRVISVLEGGYSNKALISGVLSHISGLCDGDLVPVKKEHLVATTSGAEMKVGLSGLMANVAIKDGPTSAPMSYNAEWWDESNLVELEYLLTNPTAPPTSTVRKPRTSVYSAPTHASTMKVVDPTKIHRAPSMGSRMTSAAPSRATTPPPPEVDWVTAVHELSKLLIPLGRETRSCTAAQLSEPKVKKERLAVSALPPAQVTGGRQLRDRKAKVTSPIEEKGPAQRVISRTDRRRTIADLPLEKAQPESRPRRRLSIASTVSTTSVATTQTVQPKPKPGANGLDIKKTRTAATTASARTADRPPPVPRVPSGYGATKKTKSVSPVASIPPQVESTNKDSDIDQLTSGIKKIRIKVPSNEEYAARQKKQATVAERSGTAAKPAVKKPAAPRGAKATAAPKKTLTKDVKDKATKPLAPRPTGTLPSSTSLNGAPASALGTSHDVPAPLTSNGDQAAASSRPEVSSTISGLHNGYATTISVPTTEPVPAHPKENGGSPQHGAVKMDSLFEAYQPPQQHLQQYPVSNLPPQTLQWLPPNSDPAIPQMVKPSEVALMQREAPVFSAHGFIPFAPSPVGVGQEPAKAVQQTAQSNGQNGSSMKAVKLEGSDGTQQQVDIWQVPDTPAR